MWVQDLNFQGHQRLNSWHQWPYTVGINDKLINNLPLCHWWQHHNSYSEQAPLSTKLLSPFGINGKETILWPYCSPLGHAPPVINFSSFSTFLPLWINDNKNFFWHYFFPYHWCLFDGLVFCHTDTSGINYYMILKSNNHLHISFYTFFVHFILLVDSLQKWHLVFPKISVIFFLIY